MANKTLEHYLSLPYTIEIIPDTESGGYVARVKELRGCITQADTWDDLLKMIDEAKEGWLEVALEYGHPIPEPIGSFASA
ncbi:MAG: type II toxin-antitoxin system HicB family antitoxin [Anaerolineae bacterium]|nr:type II toxin-antitoxin system HicB family antitoxin [Anaerolineae bacterium]